MDPDDYSLASASNLTTGGGAGVSFSNNNNVNNSTSTGQQDYSMAVMPDQISGIQQLLSSKYAKGSQSNLNVATGNFHSPASETTSR